jgi:hypothetical protein
MIKARLSYLKVFAAVALTAITQIPTTGASTTKSQPSVAEADLRNEHRLIGKYLEDLLTYDKETAELGKRARLVQADIAPVERKSQDLKTRLSGIQDAVREIVKKLKDAGEWADLDKNLVARITNNRDKAFFQQNSFKKFLENASSELTSHDSEITAPLDGLRKKLASRNSPPYPEAQTINAAYETPAPFFGAFGKCLMANIQLGLTWRLGGQESPKNQNQRLCYCDPSPTTCANAAT